MQKINGGLKLNIYNKNINNISLKTIFTIFCRRVRNT